MCATSQFVLNMKYSLKMTRKFWFSRSPLCKKRRKKLYQLSTQKKDKICIQMTLIYTLYVIISACKMWRGARANYIQQRPVCLLCSCWLPGYIQALSLFMCTTYCTIKSAKSRRLKDSKIAGEFVHNLQISHFSVRVVSAEWINMVFISRVPRHFGVV